MPPSFVLPGGFSEQSRIKNDKLRVKSDCLVMNYKSKSGQFN